MRGHFTVEDLRGEAASEATLYRNLPMLEEAGVIRRVPRAGEAGRGEAVYEHAGGAEEHHDHLVCVRCGRIVEFTDPAIEVLQEAVAERHGFVLLSHRFELSGLCGECSELEGESQAGGTR